MQSAFVDIGLERDAFLYVSDFMELEEHDDDLTDVVPTNRPPLPESRPQAQSQPRAEAQLSPPAEGASYVIESEPFADEASEEAPGAAASEPRNESNDAESRDRGDRGGYRGRRRRRGRRGEHDRNDRSERSDRGTSDSRYSRPASVDASPAPAAPRGRTSDYGPPPGYRPIILPGESISKYRGMTQQASPPAIREAQTATRVPDAGAQVLPISSTFPDDEPLFATGLTEPLHEQHGDYDHHEEAAHQEWERSHALQERMNLTAAFAGNQAEAEDDFEEREEVSSAPMPSEVPSIAAVAASMDASPVEPAAPAARASSGTVQEEEIIEEEEADIPAYAERLEDDGHFEELEEEISAAEDYRPHSLEIAATGEPSAPSGAETSEATIETVEGQIAPLDAFAAEPGTEEEAEEDSEEAEIEDAQAEAEALLEAEARGNGMVDARVEVRAPSGTAGYTQRARRPEFDRRRGRRGGRRFRPGGPRRENTSVPQISDLLKEGQEVLIQIAKEPIGKKGARITSHIALPGRFLVYMPTVNHTGVSRKISSDEERQRLKRIIISERENGQGGFIVRTAAAGASEDELRADIRFLKNLWHEIKTRAEESKAPALIYHDLNVVERVLRDQVTSDFSAIWVDTEQEYERILRFANRFQPALVRRVKLYTKETPLFDQFGLKEEIDKALKSKVWLKSGGYIVINQTEALVAIDINTGKYVGKTARLEDTIVKTNVDAIKEIVRQIRLRDLGGIIIIDFIDMDERRNRQKVMQALEEELRNDRAPSKVLQFNDFGLVAITRKRVKQSLERTIGSPCPYCESTGFVKSVTTVCNEVYVEMRKMAKHLERQDVMLRVNPEVAKALKAQNGHWLNEMEELTKRTIIVKSDPALHQEQFDIN
jgi:ribonuclease G